MLERAQRFLQTVPKSFTFLNLLLSSGYVVHTEAAKHCGWSGGERSVCLAGIKAAWMRWKLKWALKNLFSLDRQRGLRDDFRE